MRSAKVGALVLAVALSILLAGCSAQIANTAVGQPSASATASQRALPEVTLTSADLAACSAEPTKSRIEGVVAESTISPENSPLALPQDLGTYEKATTQMKAWDALSVPDRLFQLCFNYQQGSFGTNTPAP
jgi:hypothetical protein